MSIRTRVLVLVGIVVTLAAAGWYRFNKDAARKRREHPLVRPELEEARFVSRHWYNRVVIDPLGLQALAPNVFTQCFRIGGGTTQCQTNPFELGWEIHKDPKPGDVSRRILAKEAALRVDPDTYVFGRTEVAGFAGYVTERESGHGALAMGFEGFRDDPKLGPITLSISAASDYAQDQLQMLGFILSTRRIEGRDLALSPPTDPDAGSFPSTRTRVAMLEDDHAGWGAWSEVARSIVGFNREDPLRPFPEAYIAPLQRRMEQYQDSKDWSTFMRSTPFALALAHWSWREPETIMAHLHRVADNAQRARKAHASDAIEWSLYQCDITFQATFYGLHDAARVMASSLDGATPTPFFEEAPRLFDCLALLTWDPEIKRKFDAWVAPETKLPPKTDCVGVAGALGEDALATDAVRRRFLSELDDTSPCGYYRYGVRRFPVMPPDPAEVRLRVRDVFAAAISRFFSKAGQFDPGASIPKRDQAAKKIKAWLQAQPLEPVTPPRVPRLPHAP